MRTKKEQEATPPGDRWRLPSDNALRARPDRPLPVWAALLIVAVAVACGAAVALYKLS